MGKSAVESTRAGAARCARPFSLRWQDDFRRVSDYQANAESALAEGFVRQVTDPSQKFAREAAAPPHCVHCAKVILRWRRRRAKIFDGKMFNEPAWEGLLALYVEEASGLTVTVGRLAGLVGAPVSIFLRWVEYLQGNGLVIQTSSRRAAARVALTKKGRCDLELYLSGIAARCSD